MNREEAGRREEEMPFTSRLLDFVLFCYFIATTRIIDTLSYLQPNNRTRYLCTFFTSRSGISLRAAFSFVFYCQCTHANE